MVLAQKAKDKIIMGCGNTSSSDLGLIFPCRRWSVLSVWPLKEDLLCSDAHRRLFFLMEPAGLIWNNEHHWMLLKRWTSMGIVQVQRLSQGLVSDARVQGLSPWCKGTQDTNYTVVVPISSSHRESCVPWIPFKLSLDLNVVRETAERHRDRTAQRNTLNKK